MKTIYIKYFFFFILLYIYLYNPIFQFLYFGSVKIVLLIAILYIIIKRRINFIINVFRTELFFTVTLVLYSFFSTQFGNQSAITLPYRHIVWFMECFIIPSFFMFFFKDIIQRFTWESIIVQTGFFASLITLYLILNPEFNEFVRSSLIEFTSVGVMRNSIVRGFAIAEGLSYTYGIVQGLILAICIFSFKKSIYYLIPPIFIFISILFNARIGFSSIFIALVLMLLYKQFKAKYILYFFIIIYIGNYALLKSSFYQDNEMSIKWGMRFFSDTQNIGNLNSSSQFYHLSQMVFLPQDLTGIIFGEGRTASNDGIPSDIGYVNQIYIGGLVYLAFMFLFLAYMFKRNYKDSTNKLYPILFISTLLVVNIKGDALFVPSGFFRLISYYYVYSIFIREKGSFLNKCNQGDSLCV